MTSHPKVLAKVDLSAETVFELRPPLPKHLPNEVDRLLVVYIAHQQSTLHHYFLLQALLLIQ